MESLKQILAKEVKKPKELLTRTKDHILLMIRILESLEKEAKNYFKELHLSTAKAENTAQAEETKAWLLGREPELQTLAEALHQIFGEEFSAVCADWPEEYLDSIKEMDYILNNLVGTDKRGGIISWYGEVVRKSKSLDDAKSILSILVRIKGCITNLEKYAAVEEAIFDRDLKVAINNHINKDFNEHTALYAGELMSTWNNYLRKKYFTELREVEVKSNPSERTLEFRGIPIKEPTLLIEIDSIINRKLSFKIEVKIRYDLRRETFGMTVYQISRVGNRYNYMYEEGGNSEFKSLDTAFDWVFKKFRDMK